MSIEQAPSDPRQSQDKVTGFQNAGKFPGWGGEQLQKLLGVERKCQSGNLQIKHDDI